MTKNENVFNAVLRQDLLTFAKMSWATLYPGKPLRDNWHIEAIIHNLALASSGEQPRLIVNLPPRHLKSFLISIVFPAWILGQDPTQKIICISYADDLSKKFTDQFRQIIHANWYQRAFPEMRIGTRDTQTEITTTKNGGRFTTSTMGTLTGRGGDVIIIDDPLKGEDALSEKKRNNVNDWFDNTLFSRLDDKKRSICIVVMQRMHENDLTGYLEEKGEFNKISFSAIATQDECIPIGKERFHWRKVGTALHPAHEDMKALESVKNQIGSVIFSAQYQQEPVPAKGNFFKREWLHFYEDESKLPENGVYAWSWDTASSISETADYSVGTLWYVVKGKYFLLKLIRQKLEFTDLRNLIISEAAKHRGCAIIIENASSGLALLQTLQHTGLKIIAFPTKFDKETRATRHLVTFESGQVLLPKDAPWLGALLNELLAFPNAKHDDQVDSITQALEWAERAHNPRNVPEIRVRKFGKCNVRNDLRNLRFRPGSIRI